ncbi:uncharacterized protein J8A68_002401 [[Candida] subhashii]|uniref:Uncharacterized protein n=1 Tax=[Candida] subhashii TaxID=561895 RepID=A0A8J5QJ92_9ASCO|nr:uncharacterized protein J8A68_002401 [[Candida] subhashii]KAG7664077.1 hypothetical protein J8A68_002401 [[Candida] subhashii]
MAFISQNSGIAASVFLSLYVIYTAFAIKVVYEKGWKSIYTSLLIYGILRTAGQLCGVAFAALGYSHYQWLIAYLVFSAEGYFVLILTSFHLIAQAQIAVYGDSWIRPTRQKRKENIRNATTLREKVRARYPPALVFHLLLIPANSLIIVGGSILAGQDPLNPDQKKVTLSKALRTSGQVVFLTQTFIAIGLAVYVFVKERLRHSNIYSIFMVSPFILVRGIFGVLSIYIQKMNYFDMSNYTATGLSESFVAFEYVLATTMEFISACIYIGNYYFDSRYTAKVTNAEEGEGLYEKDTDSNQKIH